MKLPTFQAQKGTSMASAMTTPARVGNIKERIPVTKRLAATRDVGGELALGIQKSRRNLAIGALGVNIANEIIKVKETDDNMAMAAATGEYNNRMAQWTTNAKLTANELNEETGKRRWETFEEDRERESKALKAELRDKHQFSMRSSEATWALKTDGVDAAHQENIAIFQHGMEKDRANANYQIAMAGTKDPKIAGELTSDMIDSDMMTEGTGVTNMANWQAGATYDTVSNSLYSKTNDELIKIQQDIEAGTPEAMKMSEEGRAAIVKQSQEQILSNHVATARKKYETEGILSVARYADKVSRGGMEASYTRDETAHNKTVDKIMDAYNDYKAIDKARDTGQKSAKFSEVYLSPWGSQEDVNAISYAIHSGPNSAENKKTLERMSVGIAVDPDRYKKESTGAFFERLGLSRYVTKTTRGMLEGDILGTDYAMIFPAIAAKEDIESRYPRAFESLDDLTKKKILHAKQYRDMNPVGSDPKDREKWVTDMNKAFIEVSNKPAQDINRINDTATQELKDTPAKKHLIKYLAETGNSRDILMLTDAELTQEQTDYYDALYKDARQYSGDANAAGQANRGFLAEYTPTLMGQADWSKPSGIEPVNFQSGPRPEKLPELWAGSGYKTAQYVRSEIEREIEPLNAELNEADKEELSINNVDVRLLEGDWVLVDENEFVILGPDGNPRAVEFDKYIDPQIEKQTQETAATTFDVARTQQGTLAAQYTSHSRIPKGTGEQSPRSFGLTLEDAKFANNSLWEMMTDEMKEAASNAYTIKFNQLIQANQTHGSEITPSLQADIKLYMFGEGYLEGDEDYNLKIPAGAE